MANTFTVNLYPFPAPGDTSEKLTVGATATDFVKTWYNGKTKFVLIDFQAYDAYVTFDGSTPTTTNGHLYKAGTREMWSANQADAAKFIRSTSDCVVFASPFTS